LTAPNGELKIDILGPFFFSCCCTSPLLICWGWSYFCVELNTRVFLLPFYCL